MEPGKVDNYRSSGIGADSVFNLSDHDITVPATGNPDPLREEFQKLPPAEAGAASAPIELPPFVNADGKINSMELRLFLVDTSNRASDKLSFVLGQTNPLNEAAVLTFIPWVTGVARIQGQGGSEYFAAVDPQDSISTFLERVRDADQETADRFEAVLKQTLSKFGQPGSSTDLPGFDLDLKDLILRDPKNVCRMMVDIISPHEGTGTQSLGAALLAFRKICGVSQ